MLPAAAAYWFCWSCLQLSSALRLSFWLTPTLCCLPPQSSAAKEAALSERAEGAESSVSRLAAQVAEVQRRELELKHNFERHLAATETKAARFEELYDKERAKVGELKGAVVELEAALQVCVWGHTHGAVLRWDWGFSSVVVHHTVSYVADQAVAGVSQRRAIRNSIRD